MSEHYSLDELAELDAGLLARRRAAAAARHLASCEECQARADVLRRTSDALHELGPVRMPTDIATRLDQALANAGTIAGEDVVPDLGAYREQRVRGIPRWTYAAAAAVVVLGGTAIAVGTHHSKNADTVASDAGLAPLVPQATESTTQQQLQLQESGRTYTPDSIANLAAGLTGDTNRSSALAATTPEFAGAAPGTAGGGSGKGPQDANTTKTAKAPAIASAPAPAQADVTASSIAPELRRLADSRSELLRCAAFISDTPNASPIAVDFGRWTNAEAGIKHVPAVIFVFTDLDDPNSIDVFVVRAACDDNSLLDYEVLDNTP